MQPYPLHNGKKILPENFILPRWTINARYKVGNVGKGLPNPDCTTPLTLWSIQAKLDSPLELKKIDAWLDCFLEEQTSRKKTEWFSSVETVSQVDSCANLRVTISGNSHEISRHHIFVCDPPAPVKTKGRPKVATRLKSANEMNQKRKKENKELAAIVIERAKLMI